MKKLSLAALTLPLLLAACGGGGIGASQVSVSADDLNVTVNSTSNGSTTFTFTVKAGSHETTVNSATLSWTDPATNTTKSAVVNLPAINLPAGVTCDAVATDANASCGMTSPGASYADRTISKTFSDNQLFASVQSANPSVKDLDVNVKFNNTANTLPFKFTSQSTDQSGGVVTEAPKPVIIVNNTSYATDPNAAISNTLSVTVSANAASGVGVKQLILEVTDAKGIVTTTTVDNKETFTFNLDTTKYPDGALKLRAIAIDNQDRRGETAAATTVKVANAVSPTIRITDPLANAEVTGLTPIVVQIQQNNTPFTFVSSKATIEIVDSGDRIITTQEADIVKVNDGLWEARSQIDLNSPQYINGMNTVRAKTNVRLSGAATDSTILATSTFVNKSRVDEAPALNIMMPAYYGSSTAQMPVLTRKSAVFVQVSDSDKVNQINLRFVCDPVNVMPGQSCNTNVYSYNIPVGVAGIQYRLFNTGILMDGEPYLPDGYYTMRATATDETNLSSFREMRVEVNRSKNGIANLGYNGATPFELASSKLTPAGATWKIDGTTANYTRVIELFYDKNDEGLAREKPSAVGIDTYKAPGSVITSGAIVFPAAGTYATSFLVQDLKTGIVEFYDGANITATPKQ